MSFLNVAARSYIELATRCPAHCPALRRLRCCATHINCRSLLGFSRCTSFTLTSLQRRTFDWKKARKASSLVLTDQVFTRCSTLSMRNFYTSACEREDAKTTTERLAKASAGENRRKQLNFVCKLPYRQRSEKATSRGPLRNPSLYVGYATDVHKGFASVKVGRRLWRISQNVALLPLLAERAQATFAQSFETSLRRSISFEVKMFDSFLISPETEKRICEKRFIAS